MRKMGYYYSSKFSGKCNVYIAICYFISLAVLGLSCIMWNFFFFFFSYSIQTQVEHVESSSLTRDGTWDPALGVLATGPPGKSLSATWVFINSIINESVSPNYTFKLSFMYICAFFSWEEVVCK